MRIVLPKFQISERQQNNARYEEAQELQERPSYMSTLHYNGHKQNNAQYEEAQELQERPSYMSTLHYNGHKMGRVNSMWNPMNSHEFM